MAFTLTRTGEGDLAVSLGVFEQGGTHHVRLSIFGDEMQPITVSYQQEEGGDMIEEEQSGGREVLLSMGGNQQKDQAALDLEEGLQALLQAYLEAKGI